MTPFFDIRSVSFVHLLMPSASTPRSAEIQRGVTCSPNPIHSESVDLSRCAYVLAPHDDQYFIASLVVAKSLLDVKTRAKIVFAVVEHTQYLESLLQIARELNIRIWIVQPPPRISYHDYASSLLKVTVPWNLTTYQKVIWLDMDCVVLRNIDHLFACPSLSAVDHMKQIFRQGPRWLCTALMVIKPSIVELDRILQFRRNAETISDMDVINHAMGGWLWRKEAHFNEIPHAYMIYDRNDLPNKGWGVLNFSQVYTAHWSNVPKPFFSQWRPTLIGALPIASACKGFSLICPTWFQLYFKLGLDAIVRNETFKFNKIGCGVRKCI
eukprot:765996-Hanusia_phi.AAC.1